jgi:hypothetical protein
MDFNVKDQQYSYKKSQFESFNKTASGFVDNYRKLIRDSKEAGKIRIAIFNRWIPLMKVS